MRFAGLLVVVCLLVAGCTKSVSYDQEVDDLGKRIVSEVKALPGVSDASCKYDHGIDLGQHLRLRTIMDASQVSPAAIQEIIDTAVETFWRSPARVGHLAVSVYSSDNPPSGDSDEANQSKTIGSEDIRDTASADRPRLAEKYGPRPTRSK
jgi:hypothetical protein